MTHPIGRAVRMTAVLGVLVGVAWASHATAATIIDEWSSVSVPPPPEVKPVTIDRSTTALLMLDFNQQTCNMQRRPRCVASIPHVKKLLAAARAAGIPVAFTLGGGGKPSDLPKELEPAAGEPVTLAGVDKFVETGLESFLKGKGVKTVIVVGTAAHGAVLYTASGAAMRGFKVIAPLDGISADNAYAEQYTAWHLANVPVLSPAMTLTTLDGVKF
jgi:nicotinamidase-related amidase